MERSRRLAELAEALEQAQRLTWRLGATDSRSVAAMELYARLEAVRVEVQSLQLRRFAEPRPEYDRAWTDFIPWEPNQPEQAA